MEGSRLAFAYATRQRNGAGPHAEAQPGTAAHCPDSARFNTTMHASLSAGLLPRTADEVRELRCARRHAVVLMLGWQQSRLARLRARDERRKRAEERVLLHAEEEVGVRGRVGMGGVGGVGGCGGV